MNHLQHVHSHQPGPTPVAPSTPAETASAAPEREYQAIVVEVAGRDTPRTKVVAQEMNAGEIADSMEDLFAVLGAILNQTPKGKKAPGADDILSVDMKRLLMLPPVRTALFNVTARAIGHEPTFVRSLDMASAVAVTAATVQANMSFFATLPALLGLGKAPQNPASNSQNPTTSPTA